MRAVGWLSASEPFDQGDVPPEFADRLRTICAQWGEGLDHLFWAAAAGAHQCELCNGFASSGNIGIPAEDLLFVAPEMVSHYVDVHHYRPPASFIAALMACPDIDTEEYARATAPFRELNEQRLRRLLGG